MAAIVAELDHDRAAAQTYHVQGSAVAPLPPLSVDAVLRRWAVTQPNRPFLTGWSHDGVPEVVSYASLERRTGAIAAALGRRKPYPRRIALLPVNDVHSVVTLVALLRAALPCLLLDPTDPPVRLAEILDQHPCDLVVWPPGHSARSTCDLGAPSVAMDELVDRPDQGAPPSPAAPALDDPALLFCTSGSTAASKVVVQPHRAVVSNARAVTKHHRLDPTTKVMGGLPIHHVNGVHFTVVAPLYAGAHVVLPGDVSPFTYRDHVEAAAADLVSTVPSVLELLLATARGQMSLDRLRYFVSAAAPLGTDVVRRIDKVLGKRVVQGYGLTETTNFSTTVPVDLSEATYAAVALDTTLPSVGVAIEGNEVEALDPGLRVLGEGATGEICMRGHNVMTGYDGRPDLTAEAFHGGWFHSGDLGYWATAPDGRRYFYITGRAKNVAKVGGVSVSLEEVERALLSLSPVRDAACVVTPHPLQGEQIEALIWADASALPTIRDGVRRLVPRGAVPTAWHVSGPLPRTKTGKLRRARLTEFIRRDPA